MMWKLLLISTSINPSSWSHWNSKPTREPPNRDLKPHVPPKRNFNLETTSDKERQQMLIARAQVTELNSQVELKRWTLSEGFRSWSAGDQGGEWIDSAIGGDLSETLDNRWWR
jgi:hypothetical protein